MLHGSSTTWFQTSRYCRAKVEFNSINWVRHGSSTALNFGGAYSTCVIPQLFFSFKSWGFLVFKKTLSSVCKTKRITQSHGKRFSPVLNRVRIEINVFSLELACELVSLAADFWMSRMAPPWERCVTSKKRLRGRLPTSKLSRTLRRRGGKRKQSLQLQSTPAGA